MYNKRVFLLLRADSQTLLLVFLSANTYFFMVQAQGIMLRDNVRTIGQMIRLYTNKNGTLNGTGESYTTAPPVGQDGARGQFDD